MKSPVRLSAQGTLLCPQCGGEYLHQTAVDVHFRQSEDGSGVGVIASMKGIESKQLAADSPLFLGRRDDLIVSFWCELCEEPGSEPFRLSIVQHKGVTLLAWMAPVSKRVGHQ